MKWIIRIACFLATTAIYIPIESALSSTNTSRPLVWFLTGVIYLFIFYIPSRALISVWDHRKSNTTTSSTNASSTQPPRTPQPEREAFYHITTKDGDSLRIPASKMDDYFAANTSRETVENARSLCAFLMRTATSFAKNAGFPCNYFCFTYFWNSLYLAVQDIAKENKVDDMMTHQYRMLISFLLKGKPNGKKLIGDLTEFQLKSREALSRDISDPRSPEGMAKILHYANTILYENDTSDAPLDTISSSEYVIAVYDATEYAIQLFNKASAATALTSSLSALLSLTQGKEKDLHTYISLFQNNARDSNLITVQSIDDFIDHLYTHGYIVPSFDPYRDLGMNVVLTHKVYVPKEQIPFFKDWLFFEDWHAFKKAALESCLLLTHDSSAPSIEDWRLELAEILPGLFNTEETDLQSILERIVGLANEARSEHTSLPECIAQLTGEDYVPEYKVLHNIDQDIEKALRRFAAAINIPAETAPNDLKGRMLRTSRHIDRFAAVAQERKQRLLSNTLV